MAIYINSAEAITAQNSFNSNDFLLKNINQKIDYYSCLHPDYTEFISPKLQRRMSKIIKMGVATSFKALNTAEIKTPDKIITGTGLGSIFDTSKFLNQLIENNEDLLNPTSFIQSIHNSTAGQLALLFGCKDYNFTFTQKDISFETALIDAFLILNEENNKNVLLGAGDEITEESYNFIKNAGCTKKNNIDLYNSKTKGIIPGEGYTSFLLTNIKSNKNIAVLNEISCFNTVTELEDIKNIFKNNKIEINDIDVLISGDNGDFSLSEKYNSIRKIFKNSIHTKYKHLCGEFDTASAFATWIALNIINKQEIPNSIRFNKTEKKTINKVLVHSYSNEHKHSFILLSGI